MIQPMSRYTHVQVTEQPFWSRGQLICLDLPRLAQLSCKWSHRAVLLVASLLTQTCLDLPATNDVIEQNFLSPAYLPRIDQLSCHLFDRSGFLVVSILAQTCLDLPSPAANSLYFRISRRQPTCLDLPRLAHTQLPQNHLPIPGQALPSLAKEFKIFLYGVHVQVS